MSKHAAHFTVMLNYLQLVHGAYSGRHADEALNQCEILFRGTWAGQEVEAVKSSRIKVAEPAGKRSELAADALRTAPAVRLVGGLFVRVSATYSLRDQVAASRIPNQVDNLSLGDPQEGGLD